MKQNKTIPGLTRPLRIVIGGGSLGGLYAGLALRCIGCNVEIFERSLGHMEDQGAGLVIHEEMLAYLEEQGIALASEVSVPIKQRRYLNRDGLAMAVVWAKQKMTSWNVLYRQLRKAFPDTNYHLNEELVRLIKVTAKFM